jgi:hypothetical protein
MNLKILDGNQKKIIGMRMKSKKHLYRIVIAFALLLGVAIRVALLDWDLPYYSVDENDVVEPALAFLSGNWEPHWFRYGPLFSYLLAFIYKAWMWISSISLGWTRDHFFYRAFFESTPFYEIARAFHGFVVMSIAYVSYLFARRNFAPQASLLALVMGFAPFLDIVTRFTVRIDTLVGLFNLSSLYFATQFGKDRIPVRPYILSGFFAGLGIATKLPGLLVVPALMFSHFLAIWQIKDLTLKKRIVAAVKQPALWILLCSVIVAHSLANPYSVINFKGFLQEQISSFGVESESGLYNYYRKGYDFWWLIPLWGKAMVVAIIVTLLTSWRRSDNATRVLLAYVVVFGSAFLVFQSRAYWYNAVFPAVILLVARFVSGVSESVVKWLLYGSRQCFAKASPLLPHLNTFSCILMILLTVILLFVPYKNGVMRAHANCFSQITPLEKRADYAAQLWIESQLPAHSSILMLGRYAINLPRLIADEPDVQAVWADYFDYRRDENPSWRKAYESAYMQLRQSGKRSYNIIHFRERYSNNLRDLDFNTRLREHIAEMAIESGRDFIVVALPLKYRIFLEGKKNLRLLAHFGESTGHKGGEVKIFEVLP